MSTWIGHTWNVDWSLCSIWVINQPMITCTMTVNYYSVTLYREWTLPRVQLVPFFSTGFNVLRNTICYKIRLLFSFPLLHFGPSIFKFIPDVNFLWLFVGFSISTSTIFRCFKICTRLLGSGVSRKGWKTEMYSSFRHLVFPWHSSIHK